MKIMTLLLAALFFSCAAFSQHAIKLQNLWMRPQVNVLFQGYTVSFTIKDIDKALSLLAETGDTSYGLTSGLDTAQAYAVELFPGTRNFYRTPLQPLMQNAVGVFLLLAGHAEIRNEKHKLLTEIASDIQPNHGSDEVYILFTDPKANKLLFSGKMHVDMYNRDLGID